MLGFSTLAAASAMACTPVPGADRLWEPSTRWVIVGEIHGTVETPAAFTDLACLASETGRPVVVAIEYSADWQSVVDAWLLSDGGEAARAALMTLRIWRTDIPDGRGSVAFLDMLDRLRRMKQAGQIAGVVCADVSETGWGDETRDSLMARAWQSIDAPEDGIILALVGNAHAMRLPWTLRDRTIVTAASLMPPERAITVSVFGNGGTAWNCREGGCGPRPNGPPRAAATGITYLTAPDARWGAIFELGVPTTAAEPAASVRR
jgi:hypothetical protein